MINIAIDGNEANVTNRVGISEYAYWLMQYFSDFIQVKSELEFSIYLKQKPLPSLPQETKGWEYKVFGPTKFWTQFALPLNLYVSSCKPDVFFSLTHYAPRFSPVPTVVSVMDVSYLYFSDLFKKSDLYQLRHWTAYSVKKAKKVITISNSTKNDIIKEYGMNPENVVAIYPGIKQTISLIPNVYGMNQLKAKYQISDKFFLFVGTLQPRKNISRLIEAFAMLVEQKKISSDMQLVIVGKKGWLYEEILKTPEVLGISAYVKFLDAITDDELKVLYSHAVCFILPSLYEGFGLPVLEAMSYGCPVITSNISSLPEAGGDAALYVNPNDVTDISNKMRMLLDDSKLRSEMIAKGKVQIKKFSWEKTAKQTLAVLEDVIAHEK